MRERQEKQKERGIENKLAEAGHHDRLWMGRERKGHKGRERETIKREKKETGGPR